MCERIDLQFAMLLSFLASMLRGPDDPTPKIRDFMYQPWSEEYWDDELLRRSTGKGKSSAELLKSIFSTLPGVTVVQPPSNKPK